MNIQYLSRVGIVVFGSLFLAFLSVHAYVDPGIINTVGGFLPMLLGSIVIILGVLVCPLKRLVTWLISKIWKRFETD